MTRLARALRAVAPAAAVVVVSSAAGGSSPPAIVDLGGGSAAAIDAGGDVIGNGCTNECPSWAVLWRGRTRIALVPHPTDDRGSGSEAAAVDDRGRVVGWTFTTGPTYEPGNVERAFVWRGGRTTFLPGLAGGGSSAASFIDAQGRIGGWSETRAGRRHAVLWTAGGRIRDLGTLGGRSSAAVAANDRGQVVGWSETRTGARHAFLWQDGRMRDLGAAPGRGSEATAVDAQGVVIGITFAGTEPSPYAPVHGVVWTRGSRIDLGKVALGELAVNAHGQVAGTRDLGRGRWRAFTWSAGRLRYLPVPAGVKESRAHAINDRGQIVGEYVVAGVTTRPSLWQDGRRVELGFLGRDDHRGTGAKAYAVNEHGAVVGVSWHFMDTSHAVLWPPAARA